MKKQKPKVIRVKKKKITQKKLTRKSKLHLEKASFQGAKSKFSVYLELERSVKLQKVIIKKKNFCKKKERTMISRRCRWISPSWLTPLHVNDHSNVSITRSFALQSDLIAKDYDSVCKLRSLTVLSRKLTTHFSLNHRHAKDSAFQMNRNILHRMHLPSFSRECTCPENALPLKMTNPYSSLHTVRRHDQEHHRSSQKWCLTKLQCTSRHHRIRTAVRQILPYETWSPLTDSILVQHKVLLKSSVTATTWEQQTSRISRPSLLRWLMPSSQTTAGNFVVMDTVVHGSLSWTPPYSDDWPTIYPSWTHKYLFWTDPYPQRTPISDNTGHSSE